MKVPTLDQRTHAWRPDLAALDLRGKVPASHFVEPEIRWCKLGRAPLFATADLSGQMVTEVRYGEILDVYEQTPKHAWVQNQSDGYVGYTFPDALSDVVINQKLKVAALSTYVYAAADIKSTLMECVTLGCKVAPIGPVTNKMQGLAGGGFVFADHLHDLDVYESDYVFTAGRMLGAPYLWGGRTAHGMDCSGLVQMVLEAAGISCPRDSDQQLATLGMPLTGRWQDHDWSRGDIVFFPGHVGIMTGATHLIHANAHAMQVTVEPLADVAARGSEISGWAPAGRVGQGAGVERVW